MTDPAIQGNPLKTYFRQPKLHVKLPSMGRFYKQGALEMTETGEFPIYPMTARDEIAVKTPDSLLNGQATMDVITSCVPNIKDPWQMPAIDLEAVLIAIRLATYGHVLNLTAPIPGTEIEKSISVDLRVLLDQITSETFDDDLVVENLKIKIRPTTYKEYNQSSIQTFEEQRIFNVLTDQNIDENKRIETFNRAFRRLTEITVNMVASSIVSIQVDDQEPVTNRDFIKEFLENADKIFYESVMKHLEAQRNKFAIKPFQVETTPEEQQAGAPAVFTMPFTLDYSSFFAQRS